MKIRISALDALFSRYIRTRAGWRCEVCGKSYLPPTQGLHCAHIFSRGKKSIRFDPDNAIALCFSCHRWADQHQTEKEKSHWDRIGTRRFNALLLRGNTPRKPDQALIRLWLRQELQQMEAP